MLQRIRSVGCEACLVALVLGASVVPARAQSEAVVRGEVVAAADESALAGAVVTLAPVGGGETQQAEVDADGRFVLRQVVPGEYMLSGSADGFASREMRVTLEPREVRTVTLSLDLRRVEVDVQVTARAPILAGTHSPSSTVVTAARIETLPPDQQASLPEAIVTSAPGMIRGHDDFVHIRGHEVALNPLINGVSFWENPHALFSAGLSPMVIDTANIMTGGFPAEYGNRFGGVIDIVTKSGLSMQNTGSAAAGSGEAGRRSVSAEFGGRRRGLAYYLFGSATESDRFLSPPAPEAIHDSGRGGHAFFQLDGDLGPRGLLRVLLMGNGVNFEIPKTPADVTYRPQALAGQRARQQSAIVGWTRAFSSAGLTSLSATFYQRWSSTRLTPADGLLTAKAALDQELLTIGGKADLTHFAGAHAVKAGVDVVSLRPEEDLSYDYNGYRQLTHLLGLPHFHIHGNRIDFAGRETGGQVSGYVQDAIQVGDRVTADLGVRVDRYDLVVSATHASPRVNVAFRAGGGAVLHASYNRFFVPPPIEGVLSSSAGLTATINEIGVALPPIEPSIENQYEIGAVAPAGPLQLALTGYFRDTDNPVHTTVWPDARIYSYASFDRERAYGLEARADLSSLARYGVTGYLNYALGRVDFYNPITGGFTTEAGHFDATNRFLAPMDQTHTLTTGLSYRHAESGVWVGTAMEYGSGTPMGHGGSDHEHGAGEADHEHAGGEAEAGDARVPAHFTADVSIGVDVLRDAARRARLSLRFDIRNLTDNLYLIAQEGEFTPGQYSIPRLISATAKVRF